MNVIDYYKKASKITCLDKYASFVNWLADDIRAIFQVVQGLIVHGSWTRFYKINEATYPYKNFYNLKIQEILDKALTLDKSDLSIPRPPHKRVIASCREFATLFCAILRSKGIPARCRCGFSTYFARDGYYEDHWICEYWNGMGWIRVDPQIDPFQQSSLKSWIMNSEQCSDNLKNIIQEFNPLNLKKKDFLSAGEAWIKCRNEEVDPNKFGIYDDANEFGLDSLYGLWFIRGNLIRDFASLNKVETMPLLNRLCNDLSWESWRLISCDDKDLNDSDWELLDTIADISVNADEKFSDLIELYKSNPDIKVPEEILQGK